jgi:hypothetical protein
VDLHFIGLDRYDIRVHRAAVIPFHLGAIGRTIGKPDLHGSGRLLPGVGTVAVTSGLRLPFGLGCRGYEQPKGLGVARRGRLGAGMGRALKWS